VPYLLQEDTPPPKQWESKKKITKIRYMKTSKIRLMELAGLLKEQTQFTFSGTDRFMDRTAINVFKKHGIDKAVLNRKYDPNEGMVEFTVDLDSALADKIGTELETADRGKGEYGGYMDAADLNERTVNEAVDPNFPVKLTINIKADDLLNMFKEAGSTIGSGAVPMDAQEFNRLVATMNEDLNNWFSNEGITWIEDGLNSDVYGEYEDYE
jgi:hypothetical protein